MQSTVDMLSLVPRRSTHFSFLVQFFRRTETSDMTKRSRRFIVSFLFLNRDKLDGLTFDTLLVKESLSFYALLILPKPDGGFFEILNAF